MSAQEKEKVLKDWQRFLESDFSQARFTKALYNHLIQHCSFIAHYNIQGFYSSYFEDSEQTIKFPKQFGRDFGCRSVGYGMSYWLTGEDYKDINTAMVDVIELHKAEIYSRLKKRTIKKKLAQIKGLMKEVEDLK